MITSYFQVCKNTKTPYSTKVYPYLLFSRVIKATVSTCMVWGNMSTGWISLIS